MIVPNSPNKIAPIEIKSSKINILFSAGGLLRYLFYSLKKNPNVKIYYVRELLPEKKRFNIKLYLFQILEYIACKISDLVVTGNDYRKEIIQNKYNIEPNKVFVWLNMRKLEESINYNARIPRYKEKYREILSKKIVLFTSGYSLWRQTDKLILQKKYLPDEFIFVIVGGDMLSKSSKNELQIINNLIKENDIKGVFFFEKVDQDELIFLIRSSYIGCVHYNQANLNNKYCSSGKLYEFIFEETPVVTTTNPPLSDFLETYPIGVSSENITHGIVEIDKHYKTIVNNLRLFNTTDKLNLNNEQLQMKINKLLNL